MHGKCANSGTNLIQCDSCIDVRWFLVYKVCVLHFDSEAFSYDDRSVDTTNVSTQIFFLLSAARSIFSLLKRNYKKGARTFPCMCEKANSFPVPTDVILAGIMAIWFMVASILHNAWLKCDQNLISFSREKERREEKKKASSNFDDVSFRSSYVEFVESFLSRSLLVFTCSFLSFPLSLLRCFIRVPNFLSSFAPISVFPRSTYANALPTTHISLSLSLLSSSNFSISFFL